MFNPLVANILFAAITKTPFPFYYPMEKEHNFVAQAHYQYPTKHAELYSSNIIVMSQNVVCSCDFIAASIVHLAFTPISRNVLRLFPC
jgi:hypothetical protein